MQALNIEISNWINNILDIVTKFEDYKKISRFNKDKEYMNIRD